MWVLTQRECEKLQMLTQKTLTNFANGGREWIYYLIKVDYNLNLTH